MRRFVLTGMFFLTAVALPASAQSVLPSSFGRWSASGPSLVIPSSGLDRVLGSDARVFRDYSIKSLERRSYVEGNQNASVTLYRLRDPSAAYGAYTFLREDSLSPVTVGSFACASRARALIVVGNFLIDVTGKQTRPSDADLKLLTGPVNAVADQGPFPGLSQYLPPQGLDRRSVHYVLGPSTLARYVPLGNEDWIGFDYSAETLVARYRLADKDATLVLTAYPTQQIAGQKFAGMLRRFNFDPPGGVRPGEAVLFGKRTGWLVAVVVGASSREAANALLEQIHYETQVTWDEPRQALTDPSIGNIIVGTFLGTGAIMLLAIAAGLGFGGVRVLTKIFFPNRVFDRDSQIEILQLGIYSKPIQAKDFYQKSHEAV